MAKYVTRQGDQVDYICWKHYGTERGGVVEKVLSFNEGLAAYGTTLPAGLIIELPEMARPAVEKEIERIWD